MLFVYHSTNRINVLVTCSKDQVTDYRWIYYNPSKGKLSPENLSFILMAKWAHWLETKTKLIGLVLWTSWIKFQFWQWDLLNHVFAWVMNVLQDKNLIVYNMTDDNLFYFWWISWCIVLGVAWQQHAVEWVWVWQHKGHQNTSF